MFKAECIKSVGNLSSFEMIAMKQLIGACEKINDLNSGSIINVRAATIYHVENDKTDSGKYDCCIFKTFDENGDIAYMSTGSQSAMDSLFDGGEVEGLFTEMPEDKSAVVFRVKKQQSKNNQGSFIILLPVDYI